MGLGNRLCASFVDASLLGVAEPLRHHSANLRLDRLATAALHPRHLRHGRQIRDGESVSLPDDVRESWWRGTTRQWPFMAADLGCPMEAIMAHYMSNHIAVAYGDIFGELVALSRSLGIRARVFAGKPMG